MVPSIDALLLSYPDCPHLGALPYAVGQSAKHYPFNEHMMTYLPSPNVLRTTIILRPFCSFHQTKSIDLTLTRLAAGKLGLSCPIYATVPVYKMGQMFLYDVYQVKKTNMIRKT